MGKLFDRYVEEMEIYYAIRYWVSLDPESRQSCLLFGEGLRPLGMDLTTDARAAFKAWLAQTGRDTVRHLSGFATDFAAAQMGASPHASTGQHDEPPI